MKKEQEKKFPIKFLDHKEVRSKICMNQTEYWNNICVNQSSGCRYEAGANIPYHVEIVAFLVYAPEGKALETLIAMRKAITGK